MNDLIDRMIHIYGFEHPLVIEFCRLAEMHEQDEIWMEVLETVVKAHEEYPLYRIEE